jgi:hypothetical protein
VGTTKRIVKSVQWPSSADAKARMEALRKRDSEIGDLVRGPATAHHISELEKQVRYLKVLSMLERAKNPWWLVMLAQFIAGAVAKRYLKK